MVHVCTRSVPVRYVEYDEADKVAAGRRRMRPPDDEGV